MKRWLAIIFSVLLFLSGKANAEQRVHIALPEVPRVSAFEAYVKYKAGKAIIVHAGGMSYKLRHIAGSINISQEAVRKGEIKLPKLPKKGIEIFTYCY